MADVPPNTKGGGRGGPQRWSGRGPRPARHIPWPELFKHHESVLKGHLKMMDMVRKHCVEGSGNWKMAQASVDRTHEMIRDFKKSTYSFVPPPDNIERVPLGASSASMYPGYSPADHIYGEASHEYGQAVAEARKKGIGINQDPNGLEYTVGQGSQNKREQLAEIKRQREEAKQQSGDGKTSSTTRMSNSAKTEEEDEDEDPATLFTFDSNPTPVFEMKVASQPNEKPSKKAKRDHTESTLHEISPTSKAKKPNLSKSTSDPASQQPEDDFEQAVATRKAKKEAKRRDKEDRKRKRQSDLSQDAAPTSEEYHTASEQPTAAHIAQGHDKPMAERPKKKKQKKSHNTAAETASVPIAAEFSFVPSSTGVVEQAAPAKQSKKDKKRSKDEAQLEADVFVADEGEKKKKKMKKTQTE